MAQLWKHSEVVNTTTSRDGDLKVLDKKTLQRLEDIAKLNSDDKIHIFYALDNLIKAVKLKAI